jgi:hypothetical protein
VDVWGDSWTRVMVQRWIQGYPWVYAYGGGVIPVGPGISQAGMPSYSPTPPIGANVIMTPLWDANGYLILPTPYPVAPPTTPALTVGPFNPNNGLYQANGTMPPPGTSPLPIEVGPDGAQYQLIMIPTNFMGIINNSYFFMRLAPAATGAAS